MRSIGARQGVLLLVTSLGQAREVTRTTVRTPKLKFACTVDSEYASTNAKSSRTPYPVDIVPNTRRLNLPDAEAAEPRGSIHAVVRRFLDDMHIVHM